ncbi:hydrolase [Psychromonas sp. MB-3u-54]|uniref:alpha/beta fold hydrolase n=1 Tax=Psychromonas sp. MB-3u-54 TaxID=2058319 RepID=UPI000C340D5E|nr:alpha/beta hydrolase [Psychromonas sp. MB-3u-54]PKH02789.1 hydrolase [Psychromonas sp. MB-3u-54]
MGANIVLIRGLFRGKPHWGPFTEKLRAAFPHKNISPVDIPGCGELSSEISPCSIEAMVESIRSQRTFKANVDIISLSMGGMIALKWAEMYPSEVGSVVCINTSTSGFTPFYQRLLPKNYLKILRAFWARPFQRESLIYSMVSNKKRDIDVVSHWVSIERLHPIRRVNFVRQLLAALRFKVKRPSCRLLFISSIQDGLVSCQASQAMAIQWKVALINNQLDGHDIPLDNPDWLCKQLLSWLQD